MSAALQKPILFFSEPRYYCNSDGAWTIRTGSCHCNSGYEAKKNLTECQGKEAFCLTVMNCKVLANQSSNTEI